MEVPPILLDELGFEHFGIQRMVEPERTVADGHERAGAPRPPAAGSEPGRDPRPRPPRARRRASAGHRPRAPWQVAASPTTAGTRTAAPPSGDRPGTASGAARDSAERPATMSRVKYGLPRAWLMHVVHERLVRGSPEQQLQLRRRPGPVERPERELGRARQAADVRQPALQRMPQPDLARPEGRDDGEPARRRSCDHVHDRIQRRAVGPLQVVDHQHDGPLRAPPIQPGVEPRARTRPPSRVTSGKSSARLGDSRAAPTGSAGTGSTSRSAAGRRRTAPSTTHRGRHRPGPRGRSCRRRDRRRSRPSAPSPAAESTEEAADDGRAHRLGPPRPARVRLRRPRHQSGTRPPEIRGFERELRRGTRFGAGRGIRPWTASRPIDRREEPS